MHYIYIYIYFFTHHHINRKASFESKDFKTAYLFYCSLHVKLNHDLMPLRLYKDSSMQCSWWGPNPYLLANHT